MFSKIEAVGAVGSIFFQREYPLKVVIFNSYVYLC